LGVWVSALPPPPPTPKSQIPNPHPQYNYKIYFNIKIIIKKNKL